MKNEAQLEVTSKATQLLQKYFSDKEKSAVRLFVKLGGCGIRSFGVTLEERRKSDASFIIDGFEYIIDKVLLKHVQPVLVDSDGFGFRISGRGIAPQHGCGNCGFACGDGSRCTGDCETCPHKCAYGLRRLKQKSDDQAR